MRRLFWLAMGVTIGALVVRKLSRAADKLTPTGIAGSIADGLRDVADAQRSAKDERRARRASLSRCAASARAWPSRRLRAALRTP